MRWPWDQPVFDCEAVADVGVVEEGALQVADDQVDVDQNGACGLGMEGGRLDAMVNLGPLFGPISSDYLMPAHKGFGI